MTDRQSRSFLLLFIFTAGVFGCGGPSDAEKIELALTTPGIEADVVESAIEKSVALPVAEAYSEALLTQDPLIKHLLLASVYTRINEQNLPEVREVFESLLTHRSVPDAREFGNIWAKLDPKGALADVMEWTNERVRSPAADEILSVWVERSNAAVARRTLEDLEHLEVPEGVLFLTKVSLAKAMGRHLQFAELLDFLESVEDTDFRSRLIVSAMVEVIRVDEKHWLDWAEELNADTALASRDRELQQELVLQGLRWLMARDIPRALEWYEGIAGEELSEDALTVIGEAWGRQEPRETFAWLLNRPAEERIGKGLRAATYIWLKDEPDEAIVELRQAIDENPERMENVIFPVVQFLIAGDVAEAMALAQSIPDGKEKLITLKQGLVRWARKDPKAVDAYLEKHEVPDEILRLVRLAKSIKSTRKTESSSS